MEQQCVYLHTSKRPGETTQILKQKGWEIVSWSKDELIDFFSLTKDEKISWIKAFEEDLDVQIHDLEKANRNFASFIVSKDLVKKRFEKVVSMLKNSGQLSIIQKYERIVKEMKVIDTIFNSMSEWLETITIDHLVISGYKINCSRIIAKKGSEQIRYLEFLNDPIITITGPNANSSKVSLEEKF